MHDLLTNVVLVQSCSHHSLVCHWQMHYLLMEVVRLDSVQGFCHVISNHLIHWTIFDVNMAFGLLVSNVEVLDVQVMRVLTSTLASIGIEQHGTFVVLIEDIFIPCFLLREVMAPSPIEKVECHLRHPEPSALKVNLSFAVCLRNHSI